MKRYNILWIDDQYHDQAKFMDHAEQHGLDIEPFQTSSAGMSYLEEKFDRVDAVILDAKVFKDSVDEMASEKGLSASIKEIARICGNDLCIPHVILTGQPDLESSDEFKNRMDGIEVFSKNADNERLFKRLKELIGDSLNAQIRNTYREIYDACGNEGIGNENWDILLPILKNIQNGQLKRGKVPYNDLRIVLEHVFRLLERHGILHELLASKDVQLKKSCIFLTGKHATHRDKDIPPLFSKKVVFPKIIANNVNYILDSTQPGSHSEDVEKTDCADRSISYLEKYVPNHNLLYILTHMLLDVIIWAKHYIEEHPNTDENKKSWVNLLEEQTCKCEIVMSGRFKNAKPIGNKTIPDTSLRLNESKTAGLKKGDKVEVTSIYDVKSGHQKVVCFSFLEKYK